jgi:hypothetical protein
MTDIGLVIFLVCYYALFTALLFRMPELYYNPMLIAWGFRLYSITFDDDESKILVLSLSVLKCNDSVIASTLDESASFIRHSRKE